MTARAMHQSIRGSKFTMISAAGHMTPVEQPTRFARALRDYLDTLP